MCARKNKREVVFAKRRIGTAYGLVAVIAVLHFLQVLLRIGLLIRVLATLEPDLIVIRQTISLR